MYINLTVQLLLKTYVPTKNMLKNFPTFLFLSIVMHVQQARAAHTSDTMKLTEFSFSLIYFELMLIFQLSNKYAASTLTSLHRFLTLTSTKSTRNQGFFIDTPLTKVKLNGYSNNIYLKQENFQPSGSFKDRGIGNLISSTMNSRHISKIV